MAVSPPRPKGPPLNALRAFEAAARLESFAAAAEELSVTPGAVSQHIRALEQWTGAPLFARNAQGVRLTPLGRSLTPQFVAAFDQIGIAVRALQSVRPATVIHIATMPSLAQLWLSMRLARIRAQLPDVSLSVTALETPPNLRRELFDFSLFLRRPTGSETEIVLEQDLIFPVCSSALAERIRAPDDLKTVPLVIDKTWIDDWALWAQRNGLSLDVAGGSQYSLYSLALEEAKAGAGVLMGHACLVGDALGKGHLVRLFDQEYPTGKALVLEMPAEKKTGSDIMTIVRLLS